MKAFLLAAGLGTRLRPLTEQAPKCLLPIDGRPLLSYWLALFERHGVTEVLINAHHLPEQVEDYVRTHQSPVSVRIVREPVLLGSAGTVFANADWVGDGRPFFVAYADNLTWANLSALLDTHRAFQPVLTAGLFRADEPRRCGIAELEGGGTRGMVTNFEEKPQRPRSDLANAGIYVTDARVLDFIPATMPADFGHHVLPRLIGRMAGHLLSEPLIDIGTPESYARAQHEVAAMRSTSQPEGTSPQ